MEKYNSTDEIGHWKKLKIKDRNKKWKNIRFLDVVVNERPMKAGGFVAKKTESNSLDDSRGHAMVWWATHNWSQSRTYNSRAPCTTTSAPARWLIYCFTFMREKLFSYYQVE